MPTILGAFVRKLDGCVDLVQVRDITDQVPEITKAINYCREYKNVLGKLIWVGVSPW